MLITKNIIQRQFTKKSSTKRWLKTHIEDPYTRKARLGNYRSRSAFKLIHANEEYYILKPFYKVLELGSAPGGWSQVISGIFISLLFFFGLDTIYFLSLYTNLQEKLNPPDAKKKNEFLAIDLLPIEDIPNCHFIQGNIFSNVNSEFTNYFAKRFLLKK